MDEINLLRRLQELYEEKRIIDDEIKEIKKELEIK
jgi:hypothetical protein